MAKRIERMTAEQEARLPVVREQWRATGLSCEPADFERAKDVIRDFYKRIGKPEPMFFCFSSPMMCELGLASLRVLFGTRAAKGGELKNLKPQLWGQLWDQLGDQLGDQLRGQLWGQLGDQLRDQLRGQLGDQLRGQLWDQLGDQLRDQLRGQLWDQLRGQLWDQLRGQLWGQLRGQLGDQLRDQLGDQLGGQLGDQLWDQLRGQLWDQLRDQLWDQLKNWTWDQSFSYRSFWGQHESYWISYYTFAAEIGVKYGEDNLKLLQAWAALAESVCWWSPWEGVCILSDRPRVVSFDGQRRLHSDTGPAVAFSDGYSLWAINGVRVPQRIVEDPRSITVEEIDKEANQEVRRIMVQRYKHGDEVFGAGAYVRDSGGELLDYDESFGRLYRKRRGGDEQPILTLQVVNGTVEPDGTRKEYWLRIQPECRPLQRDPKTGAAILGDAQKLTALNAVASTYGMTGEQYQVERRT
jgi:hypothetical protein